MQECFHLEANLNHVKLHLSMYLCLVHCHQNVLLYLFTMHQTCTTHFCPVIQYLLYIVPRRFRRRPAEREQQAKAVGNKDHFIKNISICVCVCFLFFLKLKHSLSFTPSFLPSLLSSNVDMPPCSTDTGLWSFKAITMALKQALK